MGHEIIFSLTLKQLETHICRSWELVSIVAADALVLKHPVISIHNDNSIPKVSNLSDKRWYYWTPKINFEEKNIQSSNIWLINCGGVMNLIQWSVIDPQDSNLAQFLLDYLEMGLMSQYVWIWR